MYLNNETKRCAVQMRKTKIMYVLGPFARNFKAALAFQMISQVKTTLFQITVFIDW